MIDNLQIHYLKQLELGLKMALHGQLEAAIDMCFELRLEPDLALYTRALVNLTLADLTTLEKHPDKIKFAQEALRLADELLNHNEQENDAYWTQTYTDLVTRATQKVQSLEEEQSKLPKEEVQDDQIPEVADEVMADAKESSMRDGEKEIVVMDIGDGWFAVNPDNIIEDQLPAIEGIFSTKLEAQDDIVSEKSTKSGDSTILPKMPERSAPKEDQSKWLPTPPASSMVDSEGL